MNNYEKIIERKFPIASQTSNDDKLFFLETINLLKLRVNRFKYIEVGSFLGGSLAPVLAEDVCDLIVSIDERERKQLDERGVRYDYAGITEQNMIENLISHGLDVSKLKTHNGSINTYDCAGTEFDLAFIDGEHTDVACVRDFLWLHPKMKQNSIILFHDSTIIYKGLSIVREFMLMTKKNFVMFKHKSSEMSAIFQGNFTGLDYQKIYGDLEDWNLFQDRAEMAVISAQIANRLNLRVSYEIAPISTTKAY